MQKEWKAFRITLLLYLSIFIISLSFYQVFISFNEIQADTKMIKNTILINSSMEKLHSSRSVEEKQALMKSNDAKIIELKTWFSKNLNHVDARASESFTKLLSYWDMNKKSFLEDKKISINDKSDLSIFIIEQTLKIKQKKMKNKLYINFFILIVIMLFLIYAVRIYIQIQIKKHAIHDLETKLFNKKYFLAELQTSCARALRHDYPLSLLSIKIDNFETEKYDKKTRENILLMLGGLLTSLTRTSDVASRYDKNYFSILLTDTQEENALFLEQRIREAFKKHDFDVNPKPEFKFLTTHFTSADTVETFLARSQEL